jgi:hypothetical protein
LLSIKVKLLYRYYIDLQGRRRMKTIYNRTFQYLIILIAFILFGCKTQPEEVVEDYLDHTFLNNDGKKAYKLLSTDDKTYKSEKEFIEETKKRNILTDNILDKYKEQFYYQIIETRHTKDTSIVRVSLTRPNADNVIHEMISFAMISAITKQSPEEKNAAMEVKLAELLNGSELTTITEEREFRVIKEKQNYKLYLNLGLPQKMEKMQAQIDMLNTQAEEELRLINFEGAVNTYKKMISIQYNDKLHQKIQEIENIRKNTVNLGEKIYAGNVIFSPKSVEVRKVNIAKVNWYGGFAYESLTHEDHFVLSYEITNNSDGEVFAHEDENKYKKEHVVHDNFGNVMTEYDMNYDVEHVEKNNFKKLQPGETRIVKAVCDAPLSKTASQFLWQVKLYTDNKKSSSYVYISLNKDDIKYKSADETKTKNVTSASNKQVSLR